MDTRKLHIGLAKDATYAIRTAEGNLFGKVKAAKTELKRDRDGTWWSVTTWETHGQITAQVQTMAHGGAPKSTYSVRKPNSSCLQWEYPHALGYMLGLDTKATKRTIQVAHGLALERIKSIDPTLYQP